MATVEPTNVRNDKGDTTVRIVDLHSTEDAENIVRLLDEYASDPMGRDKPLEVTVKTRVVSDLAEHPSALVYLATTEGKVTGLAVCFLQYSTFGAFDLMNIHDFVVTSSARRRGIGRAMLSAICQDAKIRGCQKVTLEVRRDNEAAQLLYQTEAFRECEPPMLFWQRNL